MLMSVFILIDCFLDSECGRGYIKSTSEIFQFNLILNLIDCVMIYLAYMWTFITYKISEHQETVPKLFIPYFFPCR